MDKKLFEHFLNSFKLLSTADNIDIVLLSEGRKENARSVASNLSDEQFQQLLDGDPSKESPQNPYKYIEWMARQAKNGFIINDIVQLTKVYDDNLQIIPKDKSIQNFKTLKDLYSFISALDTEAYRDVEVSKDTAELDKKVQLYIKSEQDKFQTIEDNEDYILSRVVNVKGSCELGKAYGGRWCLAGGLGGMDYQPHQAQQYYSHYVSTKNILYFVMFKKVDRDAAEKTNAIIIHPTGFDNKTNLSTVRVESIHNRIDKPVSVNRFTQDPQKKEILDLILNDAKSTGIFDNAINYLSSVKTPEELKAGLDKYAKILSDEQFSSLIDKLSKILGEDIFNKANIKIESAANIKELVNIRTKKGIFVTKNITLTNIEKVGNTLEIISDSTRGREQISNKDRYDMYITYFNSFLNHAQNLNETQYLFMLKKTETITPEDLRDKETKGYTPKMKGIFYTLVTPLLTFEVVEDEIVLDPYQKLPENVKVPHIFYNGINTKLLDVLKRELLRKSNSQLRSLFGEIVKHLALPDILEGDPQDKAGYTSAGLHSLLNSFILRNGNDFPFIHMRNISREIIDTISKVPYSSMTENDTENIIKYIEDDLTSVNTDRDREEMARKFTEKAPRLLEVMKGTFGARKRFIKMIFDRSSDGIKFYDYDESKNETQVHLRPLFKHNYYYNTGLKKSELLLGLDRKEMNDFVVKTHDDVLEDYYTDNALPQLCAYIDYLSGDSNNQYPTPILYHSFKPNIMFTNKLDSPIFKLVGPENNTAVAGISEKYTEKDRISAALAFYVDQKSVKELDYQDYIKSVEAGKAGFTSDNELISQMAPQEVKEKLDKVSDAIYDAAIKYFYLNEEVHYKKVLESFIFFAENPENIKAAKGGRKLITQAFKRFAILILRKTYEYIKLATLLQDSVLLTKKYGTSERNGKLKPIIKQMIVEKAKNYNELAGLYLNLLSKLKIKSENILGDINEFAPISGLTKKSASTLEVKNYVDELVRLSQNITVEPSSLAESKVRNLIKENRTIIVKIKRG